MYSMLHMWLLAFRCVMLFLWNRLMQKQKNIKHRTANTGKMLCFCWYFSKITFLSDLGSLVSQVTECIYVNLKPFRYKKPQIQQYVNAVGVQSCKICRNATQTFKTRVTDHKQRRLNCCSIFIYGFEISMVYMISIRPGRIYQMWWNHYVFW